MRLADAYCVKQVAKGYLQERDACKERAADYIEAVYDKCGKDFSPLSDERNAKYKSITQIL